MFSVVLDKMCIFCLYPILDSQQCIKRGSCKRSILSRVRFLEINVRLASSPFGCLRSSRVLDPFRVTYYIVLYVYYVLLRIFIGFIMYLYYVIIWFYYVFLLGLFYISLDCPFILYFYVLLRVYYYMCFIIIISPFFLYYYFYYIFIYGTCLSFVIESVRSIRLYL